MPAIETFVVTLLERLFALLWNELQIWLEQPGNVEKALTYLDEILAAANIPVDTPPATGAQAPAQPPPTNGTPAAPASLGTVAAWFKGAGK